jgi:hypothetical protein
LECTVLRCARLKIKAGQFLKRHNGLAFILCHFGGKEAYLTIPEIKHWRGCEMLQFNFFSFKCASTVLSEVSFGEVIDFLLSENEQLRSELQSARERAVTTTKALEKLLSTTSQMQGREVLELVDDMGSFRN